MREQVDPNGGEAAANEIEYPSPEAIEAAAQVARDLVSDPGRVGVDKDSDAFKTWKSDDGKRSKETFEKSGAWAYIRVARQVDEDETRLIPAPVETMTVHAQTGQDGRIMEDGHVKVSGGKLVLATYTDFTDRSKDQSDSGHPREALEQAMSVVLQAQEQLETEAKAKAEE